MYVNIVHSTKKHTKTYIYVEHNDNAFISGNICITKNFSIIIINSFLPPNIIGNRLHISMYWPELILLLQYSATYIYLVILLFDWTLSRSQYYRLIYKYFSRQIIASISEIALSCIKSRSIWKGNITSYFMWAIQCRDYTKITV